MNRRFESSQTTLRRDTNKTNVNVVGRLNMPVVTDLPSESIGRAGDIIMNIADSSIYYFVDKTWNRLSNIEQIIAIVQEVTTLSDNSSNWNGLTLPSATQGGAQSSDVQGANINLTLANLINRVTSLQNQLNTFQTSITQFISESPVTTVLELRAQPKVLYIRRRSVAEYKILSSNLLDIDSTFQNWALLTPDILANSIVQFGAPYDEDQTFTRGSFEHEMIPSALVLPLTFGYYNGTLVDWEALPTTITEQDLIDSGDVTSVIRGTPISAELRRTGPIINATGQGLVGALNIDVTLYDDDSSVLQTINSYLAMAYNIAAGAAGIPLPSLSFEWNGVSYETELGIENVLTNIEQALDFDAINTQFLAQNSANVPYYGSQVELQGPIDGGGWAGYNYCRILKGENDEDVGYRTANFLVGGPPQFPQIPPLQPTPQEIQQFIYQWTLDVGYESVFNLLFVEFQFNARWRTAVASGVLDWADSFIGQHWGEASVPGSAVYTTAFTFSRDVVSVDGAESITGATYVGVGGFPYAFFDAAASPGPGFWSERINEIQNNAFQ